MTTNKTSTATTSATTKPRANAVKSPVAAAPAAAKVQGPASYFPSIERTYGKTIAEWTELIRTHGSAKHMELVGWLKTEHGMGHGHANALVAHTLAERPQCPECVHLARTDSGDVWSA